MMNRRSNKSGFTLIEIMIVVAIIIVLAALAIPAFSSARIKSHAAVCVNNLRQIDGRYAQYYMSLGVAPTSLSDLVGVYIKNTPVCPANGVYTLPAGAGSGATDALCSIGSTISTAHPHELIAH